MDKRLILAVAGSGKTSYIIDRLNLEDRSLIVTYTRANTRNLKNRIIRKFKCHPENIEVFSYYEFLYQFCIRPFLGYCLRTRGIYWDPIPNAAKRFNKEEDGYYITKNGFLFHNRMASLIFTRGIDTDVKDRLLKYYDSICVDEVQDFAGHDFNLLMFLASINMSILYVGDFYQHTFDTSRDGNVNSSLHKDIIGYKNRFRDAGIAQDADTLSHSHRCVGSICQFVQDNLGIEIGSHKEEGPDVKIVSDPAEVTSLIENDRIVKLFYNRHYLYNCFSNNWGNSKGENEYHNVCIVLSKNNYKLLNQGRLQEIAPGTRNKLYVACTRAHKNLYVTSIEHLKNFKKKIE